MQPVSYFHASPNDAMRPVLRAWAAELRSGKYQQGLGVLKSSTDKYCCLGVLGEMCQVPVGEYAYIHRSAKLIFEDSEFAITDIVKEPWMSMFANLNDVYNASFLDIADVIEAWAKLPSDKLLRVDINHVANSKPQINFTEVSSA